MKNILLTLTITFFMLGVRAADLYVEENGASGAYTTIAAAVAASSAGDRILVFPRSGVAAYGGFSYAGGGLQILSAVEGQRYRVNSNISIGALTGNLLISNMETVSPMDTIKTSAACAAVRTTRFTDCKFSNVTFNLNGFDNHKVYLQHDTIINTAVNRINLTHGGLTGCYIENSSVYNTNLNPLPLGDTLLLIGNYFNNSFNVSYEDDGGIFIGNTNNSVHLNIQNNFFKNTVTTGPVVSAYDFCTAPGGSVFINNTVYNPLSQYGTDISSGGIPNTTYTVSNNAIFVEPIYGRPNYYYVSGGYNYTNALLGFYNPFPTDVINPSLSIDVNTGAVTSAGGIDGGDPNGVYLDIDLTRNDVGCYGGSFTRANFDNADNGSRVLLTNNPRRVIQGQSINIKGEGIDK